MASRRAPEPCPGKPRTANRAHAALVNISTALSIMLENILTSRTLFVTSTSLRRIPVRFATAGEAGTGVGTWLTQILDHRVVDCARPCRFGGRCPVSRRRYD